MENVDALLECAVEMGHVGGVAVMASAHGCDHYSGAYGRSSVDDTSRMSLDTIFQVSSMIRPILAVAALGLVDAGRLDLDEPLGTVLPQLHAPKRQSGFSPNSRPGLRAARGKLTLRTLLNHTAGVSGRHSGQAAALDWPDRPASPPLLFDPGTRWHYGGELGLVAAAIERVTGGPVADFLRTAIFEVLGMRDTGFQVEYNARRRVAGGWQGLAGAPGQTAFYSTSRDYFAFAEALLWRHRSLLSQESFDLVRTNQIGALTVPRVLELDSVRVPDEINFYPEIRLYPTTERKWSLGFMVNDAPIPGGPRTGSLTCAAPAEAYCWIDHEAGVAGVLFARRTPTYPDLVDSLFSDLQRSIYLSQAVRMNHEPRRRGVMERLFEGWTKESWSLWWPM
jgi:CubicO group peptidase (beta-lactamase class C family)